MSSETTLSLQTIDYPFETLVSRATAEPPKLILDPDFQRKYKWDKDGWERASRFIESCLMRIPLPSCYFAERKDGAHLVIDGVQRITTILRFMKDEFRLEGMTTFKHLEGKQFSDLGKFKAELETTTIRCIVLRSENPSELVSEIFARLNQGGVELSDQEIRHALYPGKFDDLVSSLSQEPMIQNFKMGARGKARKDSREGDELVLRYFAFSDYVDSYDGNLKKFLDEYMKSAINFTDNKLKDLEDRFHSALRRCRLIFSGDEIFTDITKDKRRQGVVYYDLLMSSLGDLDEKTLKGQRSKIRDAFERLCKSEDWKRLTAGGLQRTSSVKQRNELWAQYLKKSINDR